MSVSSSVVKSHLGLMLLTVGLGLAAVDANASIQAGTATIDGLIAEWDTSTSGPDFYAPMHEAGDVPNVPLGNTGKDLLSNLFLRYDISTNTLFGLVYRPEGGIELSPSDAWFKEYSLGNSTLVDGDSGSDGTPPDFAWVYDPSDSTKLVGYEASIDDLLADDFPYCEFEAHVNVLGEEPEEGSRTSSTGKKNKSGYICLELPTSPPPPPDPQGQIPEPISLLIWSGLFSVVGMTATRQRNS